MVVIIFAGKRHINTHNAAKNPILTSITIGTSFAFFACSERGNARNEIPNALIKHAAASPPAKARVAPQMTVIILKNTDGRLKLLSMDWNISHSLMKPFRGGMVEMDKAPTRNNGAVICSRFINPPNSSILFVWVE